MAPKFGTLEELQSLKAELQTAQRAQKPKGAPSPATAEPRAEDRTPAATGSAAAAAPGGAVDSEKLRDEIGELMREAARFLEEKEKDIGCIRSRSRSAASSSA